MPNARARQLRRELTEAERRLWALLRDRRLAGFEFRRQHPIGAFIVDFACTKHHLAIEADGSQHTGNTQDRRRTAALERDGWHVLRFWNNDILANKEGVITAILTVLAERQTLTHPALRAGSPLSRGAGEGI